MFQASASRNVPGNSLRTPTAIVIFAILCAVALPRLMLIGGLPATDEGVFAYFAQLIHASLITSKSLPNTGPLALYPFLCNWVFAFNINPLVALRLIDMLVAILAGYLFYRVIEIESGSRLGAFLICLLFLFTMNQPVFIQYGFKNSMFAAYVPLFAALWLGLAAPVDVPARRWVAIGVLLAITVLLRETFLPFAVVGVMAVLLQRGLRSFLQLIVGGIISGLLIIGLIIVSRGSIFPLLETYQNAANMYIAIADQRSTLFLSSGTQFWQEANLVIAIAVIGFFITLARSLGKNRVTSLPKLSFWLAVTLVPVVEPALKIGFPYHFGVCLPGLAGMAALGWRTLCNSHQQKSRLYLAYGIALLIVVVSIFIPRAIALRDNWPQSQKMLSNIRDRYWPAIFTDSSNYLMAAEAIRQAAPSGGTVAVSGYMYALYPLTGLLPPKPELANLTDTIINMDLSEPHLRETLLRCPPDIVMTTSRTDWPGSQEILAAVRNTGIYKEIAEVPIDPGRHYGTFGGRIFQAVKPFSCNK